MQTDNRKTIWAWAFYDWANSAFATTIMAGFFPIFFKEYWSAGADVVDSTARLGFANSTASIIVAILAPILGAIADCAGKRKSFLGFFVGLGVLMTSSLYFISKGEWLTAVFCYVLATVGFAGANIFYDSFLPLVASEKTMHRVSAFGFSLGYLGGGVLFALNVLMTLKPALFGFADAGSAVRFSFLTVAIWWFLFSLPLFFRVKEPQYEGKIAYGEVIKSGLQQVSHTFSEIRRLKHIFLFLAAYWLYIDGVDTVITMAVNYGMSIGFQSTDLITALLMVQFVGFPAAIAFGYIGTKLGAKRGIFIAILVYFALTISAAFMTTKTEFYALAFTVGLVQGGIQALSRSFYASIIPAHKSAQYFGFYNMLGKFASILGPVLVGTMGLLVRNMGYSSDIATRVSMSSLALLFVVGGILLYMVNEKKAKEESTSFI